MIFPRLLFLFVVVPLVELSLLIKLGKYLGTLNTILIVILTGILGAILTVVGAGLPVIAVGGVLFIAGLVAAVFILVQAFKAGEA